MKKILAIVLCLIVTLGVLSACGNTASTNEANEAIPAPAETSATAAVSTPEESEDSSPETEPLKIVTTIFPVYDWVREILGDRAADAELTMLLDSGVDLHSYQPTASDILKIATSDLFIYVGGESDEWVEDALVESTNPDMKVINLLETLGDAVKEEEVVEGMEEEDEEAGDEDEEEIEYDEHVWLSLRNAQALCDVIADTLSEIDPNNAAEYSANAAAYDAALSSLDAEYEDAVSGAAFDTVLFGDRFPFRYLVDDYGLNYYAAFSGCSAETEASFETIIFLAGKVDELGLRSILQIESADGSIARTIRDTTQAQDQTILTLDSLQSATAKDVADGKTYLSTMRDNLEILKAAISE